jgi:hypothetical protein
MQAGPAIIIVRNDEVLYTARPPPTRPLKHLTDPPGPVFTRYAPVYPKRPALS